jgi:hypothetical protein
MLETLFQARALETAMHTKLEASSNLLSDGKITILFSTMSSIAIVAQQLRAQVSPTSNHEVRCHWGEIIRLEYIFAEALRDLATHQPALASRQMIS